MVCELERGSGRRWGVRGLCRLQLESRCRLIRQGGNFLIAPAFFLLMRCAKTGVGLQGEWGSDCTGKNTPGLEGVLAVCTTNPGFSNFDWPENAVYRRKNHRCKTGRLGFVSRLALPHLYSISDHRWVRTSGDVQSRK